ncbi:hypothetical protein AZE42_00233 [Rhizopogon vesiculosus]|uniref:Uncharacterized protein n=1 Tax=Rhizopogon vesiculosus TaxID=180088 RepID=A0A1J8R5Y5_9AGAM|nr:hypothetical protein AZE42_00233 [Rhizopogon vesiculosus]
MHQYDIEVIEEHPPNLIPLLYDTLEDAAQSVRDFELSRTTYVNPDNTSIQAVAREWRGFYFILHGRGAIDQVLVQEPAKWDQKGERRYYGARVFVKPKDERTSSEFRVVFLTKRESMTTASGAAR